MPENATKNEPACRGDHDAPGSLYRVVGLGARGDGLLQPLEPAEDHAGEKVYAPFVLPGETVRLDPVGDDGSSALEIVTPHAGRTAPVCRHYTHCGGCAMQHASAELYRAWKVSLVEAALAQHGLAASIAPLQGVGLGARRRVALTAESGPRGKITLGFHATRSHDIVEITECPVADPAITARLDGLRTLCGLIAHALKKGERIRLHALAAANGIAIDVEAAIRDLSAAERARLAAHAKALDLIRLTLNADPVFLAVTPVVRCGPAEVAPPPSAFLQASREAEAIMASLVEEALPKRAKRAADLFCGIGALTFSLAGKVAVFAADSAPEALGALETASRNTQGLKAIETRRRDLMREPLSRKELEPFDLVVFDPPRAGAAEQAKALAKSKVPVVAAVSCNPATLARDLRTLVDGGYRIERITPIDQFVYAPHVEAVAILKRR